MTRAIGDRPLVVPHQSQNLAFIGNFAETERDTVFYNRIFGEYCHGSCLSITKYRSWYSEVINSTFDLRVFNGCHIRTE
ncbi:oleate hydratase [Staphylococcus aureus]